MLLNYGMRLYKILFFSSLFFLWSCKEKRNEGVISEKEMISLLIDIHLADGHVYNNANTPHDSVTKLAMNMYAAVFRKHQVDSTEFQKSFEFYSREPEKLNKMYDQVVGELTKMNEHYSQLHQDSIKALQKRDSIRNAIRTDSLKKLAVRDSLKNVFKKDSLRKIVVKDSLDRVKRDSIKKIKRDSLKRLIKPAPKKSLNKTTPLPKTNDLPTQ